MLVRKILDFTGTHYDFIKEQATMFSLCVSFFIAAWLCLEYESMLNIVGIIASIALFMLFLILCAANVMMAQRYVESNFSAGTTIFIGMIYVSTVVSVGLSLLFKASRVIEHTCL